MKRVALIVALVGCAGTSEHATFVRDATIDGFDLVLTRCDVSARSDAIVLGACATTRQRLPVMIDREPDQPAQLDPAQISKGLTPAIRDALGGCVARARVARARLRIVIGAAGVVTSVEPDVGGAELADCAHSALAAARFPMAAQPTRLTFAVESPLEAP